LNFPENNNNKTKRNSKKSPKEFVPISRRRRRRTIEYNISVSFWLGIRRKEMLGKKRASTLSFFRSFSGLFLLASLLSTIQNQIGRSERRNINMRYNKDK
jgi:hypothetical protein